MCPGAQRGWSDRFEVRSGSCRKVSIRYIEATLRDDSLTCLIVLEQHLVEERSPICLNRTNEGVHRLSTVSAPPSVLQSVDLLAGTSQIEQAGAGKCG